MGLIDSESLAYKGELKSPFYKGDNGGSESLGVLFINF